MKPTSKSFDTEHPPAIRIVIVVFDSLSYISGCIAAIADQTFDNFEVIIVDNGGAETNDGYHQIELPDIRFHHVLNAENTGYAGGMIKGVESAQSKWLMSVNPDTILHPNCLEHLMAAATLHNDPAMLSPCLYSNQKEDRLNGLGDSLSVLGLPWRNANGAEIKSITLAPVVEVFSPSGAAALYLRENYEHACGFDPQFFCYMEDVDLGIRLRAYGGICLLVRDATAVHSGGHSTDKITGFAVQYAARNTILMIVSSAPILLFLPLLCFHLISRLILQWRNRGSEDAKFASKGVSEALPLIFPTLKKRFKRPNYPIGASFRVASRLDWGLKNLKSTSLKYWPHPKQ